MKYGGNFMLETLQQNKVKAQEILQFHPFTIESKSKIEQYTKPWSPECSDLSFVNLFIWGIDGKMEYAEAENCLYIKCKFGTFPIYLWAPLPMKGKPCNYKKAVQLGLDYMREIGTYPIYRNIWTFLVDELKKHCPQLYFIPQEYSWDYVYDRESLATLKGKKLHGKRNHINQFLAQHPNYEYHPIDPNNQAMLEDCLHLYDTWREEKQNANLDHEQQSVHIALNYMKELNLTGGTIYDDGKLLGFTVGERLLPDMQLIHIEKGLSDVPGIYPMINQQYVIHACQDVKWINREEDMGLAGMRKAKRSYNPARMIEKYTASTDLALLVQQQPDEEEE